MLLGLRIRNEQLSQQANIAQRELSVMVLLFLHGNLQLSGSRKEYLAAVAGALPGRGAQACGIAAIDAAQSFSAASEEI